MGWDYHDSDPSIEQGLSDKKYIIKKLYEISPKIVGRKVKPAKLTKFIRPVMAGINVTVLNHITDTSTSPNMVLANAYYFSGMDGDTFELELVFCPTDRAVVISKDEWDYISESLADLIVHERIHQIQFLKREYISQRRLHRKEWRSARSYGDVKKVYLPTPSKEIYFQEVQYHADPDEIDAYAYSAANELARVYENDVSAMLVCLNNYTEIKHTISPVIDIYNILFKPNSMVMKKFISKVVRYIEIIRKEENGKI